MYEGTLDTKIFLDKRWWRETKGPLNAEDGSLEQTLSHSPEKEPTLLTLGSQSSSLHSRGTIDLYCISHSVCGTFL